MHFLTYFYLQKCLTFKIWLLNVGLRGGMLFKGGGMKFMKTFWFVRRYVYLGRYVFEKLLRMGGGTFIWVGTFIWH